MDLRCESMSHIDYIVGKVKSESQDLADSVEKIITILIGISAVGPAVVFVLSTLVSPSLVLLIPLIFTVNIIALIRILLNFARSLSNKLLKYLDNGQDEMVNMLRSSRLLMGMLDSEDPRKWFYILNIINDSSDDLMGSLIIKDVYGELDLDAEVLAKYLFSIGSSLNRSVNSVVSRGMRTVMTSYYVLLYSIPTVAKALALLGVHWNLLFIIMTQLLIMIIMYISIRLLGKMFNINVNKVLFFSVSIIAILTSLLLFA